MQHEVTLHWIHKALDREDLQIKQARLMKSEIKDKNLLEMLQKFEDDANEHIKVLKNLLTNLNMTKKVLK